MMEKLPNSWVKSSLEEVVYHIKGKKPKILSPIPSKGFVPYVDIKAFEFGDIRQYADIESAKLANEKDVLVVWDGARSGLAGHGQSGAIGSTMMALTPISIHSEYLFRFLQFQYEYINSNPRGTGIPHVDPKIFWKIKLPIAPYNEQNRIVTKLEKLLTKVEKCKERLEKIPTIIKRFRQSILAAAFSGRLSADWRMKNSNIVSAKNLLEDIIKDRKIKYYELVKTAKEKKIKKPPQLILSDYFHPINSTLFDVPDTWVWASVGQIGDIITGKTPTKKNPEYWGGNIPFIMPENLNKADECLDLKYIDQTKNYTTQKGLESVQHIEKESILVCCIGTLGRVGICSKKAAFSQQLNAVIPHKNIDIEYLAYYFHTIEPILYELWPRNTYMAIVNKTLFSKVPIPLPSLIEQRIIVEELKKQLSRQKVMENRAEKGIKFIENLTQSILAKAFCGELVPQNPSDPPASELLKQIKAEKEKQQAELKVKKKPKRKSKGKNKT